MVTKKQYAEAERQSLVRWRALPEAERQTEFQAANFAEQIERETGVGYKSVMGWITRHEMLEGHPLRKK